MAKYVDIYTAWTGTGHAGTTSDPYSYADFLAALPASENFYIRGMREVTSLSWDLTGAFIEAWEDYPWRINCTGAGTVTTQGGDVSDLILYTDSETNFYTPDTRFVDCFIRITTSSFALDSTPVHNATFVNTTFALENAPLLCSYQTTAYRSCYIYYVSGNPNFTTYSPKPVLSITDTAISAASQTLFETNLGTGSNDPIPVYTRVVWNEGIEKVIPDWDESDLKKFDIKPGYGAGTLGSWASPMYFDPLGITASVTSGMAPVEVEFSAAVSSIDVVTWLWEFGDGYKSREAVPTHVYNDPGKFDVRLTVVDSAGVTHTGVKTQYISIFRLVINATKPTGKAPLKVKFSLTEYLPEGYQLVSYVWDFGDGTDTSVEASPVHVFLNPGNYPVTVSADFSRI